MARFTTLWYGVMNSARLCHVIAFVQGGRYKLLDYCIVLIVHLMPLVALRADPLFLEVLWSLPLSRLAALPPRSRL